MAETTRLRIVVFGTRTFSDYKLLSLVLEHYKYAIGEIIEGGARGADRLGRQWAVKHGIEFTTMNAEWDYYGKLAGHRRNAQMAELADIGIGFWDGNSRGTKNMLEELRSRGKLVHIIFYNNPDMEHIASLSTMILEAHSHG